MTPTKSKPPDSQMTMHPYQRGWVLRLPDGGELTLDRPRIMGILNITPDSFSDGGLYVDPIAAVEHGLNLARQGADILDIGGESTRPGAERVDAAEQRRRVIEVIAQLRCRLDDSRYPTVISIDTTLSEVAQAALDAGARIINDISAGQDDPRILELAAQSGTPIVLMHMRGQPAMMQGKPQYHNVADEIRAFLLNRGVAAADAGIDPSRIMIDPGIGFGKTTEHNLALLAGLDRLTSCDYPVLLGTSRKRFMREICEQDPNGDTPSLKPTDLIGATCGTTAWGVAAGALIFRVHDVAANRQAADVAWKIIEAGFENT